MSLYKRGDVWHYDFALKGERYRGSTGHRSKAKALGFEEDERERVRKALGQPAKRKELTLEEASAEWFRAKQADKKSAKTTGFRLEIMLRVMGADTMVSAVDAPEVLAGIAKRRLEPIGGYKPNGAPRRKTVCFPTNTTVNRDLIDTLRPILEFSRKALKQPVAEIDWTELRLAEPKGRDRTFTLAEISAWRAALPVWHRVVFDFAARYGVRLSEAFFTLDCVDAEDGRILLRDRKNGRGHNLRLLPEDKATIAALYSRAKEAKLDKLWFREMANGELRSIRWRGFQHASRTALDRAGIADARPVHDLRHHAGTTLVRKTGNLAATKALLGHDNIQSTMRYVHADDDDVFEALRHAYATSAGLEPETVVDSTNAAGT